LVAAISWAKVGRKSDFERFGSRIASVFREFAFPYFERWGDLVAIDVELNDKPAERTPHRGIPWERCSKGIIVARLVGRPNYDQLAVFYTEVMTQNSKGFYLKRFQALVKSLRSVDAGSGQAK